MRTIDPAKQPTGQALRHLAALHLCHRHRAEVVSFDPPASPWVRDFPLPVHARGTLVRGWGCSPGFAAWLAERRRDYDAVIVHGLRGYHAEAVWRALYGSLTPYFIIPHGELRGWASLREIRRWLGWPCVLRDARGVLFASDAEKAAADRSSGLHAEKSHVIADWNADAFIQAVRSP